MNSSVNKLRNKVQNGAKVPVCTVCYVSNVTVKVRIHRSIAWLHQMGSSFHRAFTAATLGSPSGHAQCVGYRKPSACAPATHTVGHPWPAA